MYLQNEESSKKHMPTIETLSRSDPAVSNNKTSEKRNHWGLEMLSGVSAQRGTEYL